MKVYTRRGDQGTTSLFSGERVSKSNDKVDAYGEIDELSSVLGAVAAMIPDNNKNIINEIRSIQSDLLAVGALLATTPDSPAFKSLQNIDENKILFLEQAIDKMDAKLPKLKSFILPGGHISSAWLHIARTVCRRAERRIISLTSNFKHDDYLQPVLIYINRLSDYLFVLARYCNHITETQDIQWITS